MNDLHPFRYPIAFRSQFARLERLYPGIRSAGRICPGVVQNLAIEQTGASNARLMELNRRLHHLEALIADWRIDGENVLYAITEASKDAATVPIYDIPRPVTYVAFEASNFLSLSTQPRSRIDGCYIREIIVGGRFSAELTFTCSEPGWSTMDSCLFADAMAVAARLSVGYIPFDECLDIAQAASLFNGDHLILSDPALGVALQTITAYVASLTRSAVPVASPRFTLP